MPDKQTLLVVEDDPHLAGMLHEYFQIQGYEVLVAEWGEDALETCWKTPPHLALLDINLPDVSGYEVARRLSTHRRTRDIPLIFLTQKSERIDRLQGLELGAVDYITKPFDLAELLLRVRNTLQRVRQKNLLHPVTGLPIGPWVDEALSQLAQTPGRAVLLASLLGLNQFRERYGFVAADDALRAVALMFKEAVQSGPEAQSDFVGHLTAEDFIAVTAAARVQELRQRVHARLGPSMEYFYPLKDRLAAGPARERLDVSVGVLIPPESAADLDALKTAILRSRAN